MVWLCGCWRVSSRAVLLSECVCVCVCVCVWSYLCLLHLCNKDLKGLNVWLCQAYTQRCMHK